MRVHKQTLIGIALSVIVLGIPICASAQQDVVNQARRLNLEGKHDAAIALYQQALGRTPDSFDAHYGIARDGRAPGQSTGV